MEDGVDLDGDNEQRNGRAGQDEGGREGGYGREVIVTHCLPGRDLMLHMEKIFF